MQKTGQKMIILLLIIAIFVIAILFFALFCNTKTRLNADAIIAKKANVTICDKDDALLDSKHLYRYIKYEDISSNVINAFVSLEDKRFFSHSGIDAYRTVGAFAHNLKSGKIKEGGSTITQQLAKNTLLSSEKTLKRKIAEMKLAKQIEKKYNKEEILEMYLNAIYYGNGIYGIDSACHNYFGKNPSDLSPAEGAILAGSVKNPSKYSPANNPEAAMNRKNMVIKLMLDQGYLSKEEYDTALSYVYVKPQLPPDPYKYYYAGALHEASSILGISEQELIRSSYKIKTYCDPAQVKTMHDLFSSGEYVSVNKNNVPATYSALLADNNSGGISAFYSSENNNVFTMRRSPASTIKPILVYAPAIEKGIINQKSIFIDEKTDFNGYIPKNYGNTYVGKISAEQALARSINTVAVKIFQQTGIETSLSYARKTGLIFRPEDDHLALALGGMAYGITLPELTEAYMTLANSGTHKDLSFIRAIETEDGQVLYKHSPTEEQVFSAPTAFIVSDMLKRAVTDGTANKLRGFDHDIASKTGTAQGSVDNTDCWNVSYTTENTLCVWYGNPSGATDSTVETTGGGYPTLLAAAIRRSIPSPKQSEFTQPYGVIECEIDSYALEKENKLYFSTPNTPKNFRDKGYFSAANMPLKASPYFSLSDIEFSMELYEDKITTNIRSNSPLRYKLIERELMTNIVNEYDVEPVIEVDNRRKRGVYSYYLAVYYENEFLGYTPNKLYFT